MDAKRQEVMQAAEALIDAIENNDVGALRELLTEDAEFWLWASIPGKTTSPSAPGHVSGVDGMVAQALQRQDAQTFYRIEDRRIDAFEDGYVGQVICRGSTRAGETFEFAICIVVHLRDGRAARIDEYADSGMAGPYMRGLGLNDLAS